MTYNGWCAIKPNQTKPNQIYVIKILFLDIMCYFLVIYVRK